MFKYFEAIEELPKELKTPIIRVLELFREDIAETVKKSDFERFERATEENFNRVWRAIGELAEAQKRTEQRVEELAEAQKRTEQRVEELAEAQKELAEAQKRTEQKVEELTEAQKRTEEEIKALAAEFKDTKRMVGGLSDTVGYTLENAAYKALPALLQRDFGVEVEGKLTRRYVKYPDGNYKEVNIFGKAKKDGKEVWVLGESKVRMSKKEIDDFLKMVKRIDKIIPGEKLLVGVSHTIVPEVDQYAQSKGIKLYWSYEF